MYTTKYSKDTDCPGGRWCPHPGLGGDPQDIVRQLIGSMPRHCREYNVWTHYTLLSHIIIQNVQCASVKISSFNNLFIKSWCVMWSSVFIASCRGAQRTSCSLFKVRQSCNKGLDSCWALPPEVKLVWLHVLCVSESNPMLCQRDICPSRDWTKPQQVTNVWIVSAMQNSHHEIRWQDFQQMHEIISYVECFLL